MRTAELVMRAPAMEEGLYCVEFERRGGAVVPLPGSIAPEWPDEQIVYRVLVLGVRDYVNKHGFNGAVIGLSGGVDSALTLAIAVDALGPERVHAVMMPSRYTSSMSREDATAQAQALGVSLSSISIENMFEATLEALQNEFAGRAPDATEENIQARCRGVLLMAISNKTGRMLLTTGNKSEMAVGYATLYGDMAGGFAPIKDCSKQLVYRLARYRNTLASASYRSACITRAPIGRAAAGPEGHRLTAAVRGARSDSRGLHRGGSVGRGDLRARFRSRGGGARARHGQARRVQAATGPAGGARQSRAPSGATGAIRSPTAIGADPRRARRPQAPVSRQNTHQWCLLASALRGLPV